MDEEADNRLTELKNELALLEAKHQEALRRLRSLDEELLAAEEARAELRQKLAAARQKGMAAEHYKSLLHDLRSRWYLRPFIAQDNLAPPKDESSDCWQYRGPAFAAPASESDAGARRPRVLIVGHVLSSMLFGSEHSLIDTICAIDTTRFDVFAVFPERNDSAFEKIRPHVQGIAVLDYAWWRLGRPPSEASIAAFTKIFREQAIDLVHANTIMLRDPLIAARRAGLPGITNARELISSDDELAARLGGSPSEIVHAVCENATCIVANSAATLADYPCREKGVVVYNSVDAAELDIANRIDPARINVGLVSSNIAKKGVADFLDLARRAEGTLPTLQFHLIGPESDLTRRWREGGTILPRNLHLRGHVTPPREVYGELNLLLNLSRCAESFGRTVAEAMAARRPAIAYRHGALPELIDDGETGFLVPYLDLGAVLDQLAFFVGHPEMISEFGERARERAIERFSPEALRTALAAVYDRLIPNTKSALASV